MAHAVNVVLELLFVYGFDWGLAGSAWGTVIAQVGMGAAFVRGAARASGCEPPDLARIRSLVRIGGEIAVRTTALLGSFLVASAVLARVGAASLGAHQIAFQLFVFLALVLDALAIAAQVMVGRMLGAGDARGRARGGDADDRLGGRVGPRSASRCSRSSGCIPRAFTDDPRGARARAARSGRCSRRMMPVNGAVFALDGILIGAGDTRFLMWAMLAAAAVYVPVALLALHEGWGIPACGAGLGGADRGAAADLRRALLGQRWALTGAPA